MTTFSPIENSDDKLHIQYLDTINSSNDNDGHDVIKGLSQKPKSLSPHYFYDRLGSQLFEQICELPEYYPTRTEASILKEYAPEIAQITGACELVELGSGSSTKTRFLLSAYQQLSNPLSYLPIDVSASMLSESATELLQDYSGLKIHGLVGTYEQAFQKLKLPLFPSAISSPSLTKRMVLFLGSSLGNFTPQQCDRFFSEVISILKTGDYFLLGIDLQKSEDILEAAYNDAQGITAAFNLNVLRHLNERFQGNFNLDRFEHRAFYNRSQNQIEMHLLSLQDQSVRLNALDLTVEFTKGETILTEISRKFDLQQMQNYLSNLGLKHVCTESDRQQWFGLMLFERE